MSDVTCPRCNDGHSHTLDSKVLGMSATVFYCETAVWTDGTVQQGDRCAHVEAATLRARVAELQERFSVTSEIWIVTVDPKRHCETWAVFQNEKRARSYNESWHGGAGAVERRIVTGRAYE